MTWSSFATGWSVVGSISSRRRRLPVALLTMLKLVRSLVLAAVYSATGTDNAPRIKLPRHWALGAAAIVRNSINATGTQTPGNRWRSRKLSRRKWCVRGECHGGVLERLSEALVGDVPGGAKPCHL
ncbi:hypothetical protein BOSEA1005_30702 [Hyphomicrobiales bacterium]|nr:hypothetical protein BOSEA1005_30702 [Hyphomicrobiales bacterium]CAI0347018.1 hypothetical protein BO1005MUT1_530194 [Hyphomicrobiales bacterium]